MNNDNQPMDGNKLDEQYEEILVKLAMASYAEYDGQQLIQENEKLRNDSFYKPTAEAKQKFMRIINHQYHKQIIKNLLQSSYNYLNKAAVFLLVLVALLAVSVVTVEAARIKVLNFFVNMQEKYTQIHLSDKTEEPVDNSINWEDAYVPTDIPSGYSIHKSLNNKGLKTIEYANDDNGVIVYQQFNENFESNIDTENADEIKKITIQGHKGLFVSKGDKRMITWSNDTYVFLITTNLQEESLIKIAESVTLKK
ncbi:MAG TPA: DUF4367 domain-containing protein [Syntrophomonadaceae bacterium]|nr:DUF4367 domain-containing protein [Syntrophomonadaceae bacterium]